MLWILCCWPSPGLGDLLSKWLPTCAVGAPRGHRAVHPWAGVATGSQRWGGLQASALQVQGQDLMMILETSNSIVFEVVWLDKSTGVKQVLGDISLPNHEILPNCFGCRWLQSYVQPFLLLHRRKDQRRHANRRRKRIPRAWRSCPRFQTCVSRIFRATLPHVLCICYCKCCSFQGEPETRERHPQEAGMGSVAVFCKIL